MVQVQTFRLIGVDLADQDQRVAHQDSRQPDQAENGVEAERLMQGQQHRHRADQAKRRGQEHHGHRRQRTGLHHQHQQGQRHHDRKDRQQRGVRLGGVLDVAAGLDPVAAGQVRNHRGQRLLDLHRKLRGLHRLVEVALHGDGRRAVAPPQDGVFGANLDMTDLAQGNQASAAAGQAQVAEPRRVESLLAGAARHHVDGADVLADLGDRRAGQQQLKLLGHLGRAQPDQLQPVLVEHEMGGRRPLTPVLVDLPRMRIGAHDLLHLVGDRTQSDRVRAHHAEIHQVARERAEDELRHPYSRLGSQALRDPLAQPPLEPVARLGVFGQDDQLGECGIGQLRVVGEEEAWRALADVGGDDLRLGLLPHPLLDLDRCGGGGLDAGAFRHLHLDQHFGPAGAGEELPLDQGHACPSDQERRDHQAGHLVLVVHRPGDQAPQPLIARRRIDAAVAARHRGEVRQQFDAEVGREHHRHQPGYDQGVADDPEDIAGVLAGRRMGEPDRREADDGHQGARQHWRRGVAPGVSRGLGALDALLQLHHHHLDGDDRIVDQQAEADHQRAEGDAVEHPAGDEHHHEHSGQGQRHRRGDHDADPPAQADQAHDHDHAQGDEELEHELVDGLADVHCLVDHLGEPDARGQVPRDLFFLGIQGAAERQSVPAVLHHHAEHQGGLAVVADQERRRVLVTTLDLGDIPQPQRAAARRHRGVADLPQAVVSAVEAHEHLRAAGVDRAGRSHGVLALQRAEHILRADAEVGQPRVGEVDEDALRALAQDVHLLDAGHMQQALPQRFGLARQLARRQALGFQGVHSKDDIRILVVDERPLHPRGQFGRFVAELLARLVELLGDVGRRRAVLQRHLQHGDAGPGQSLHPVVPAQLLHALLQRLGHQVLHFLGGGARPHGRHRQGLDDEGGVLGAAQAQEGVDAGEDDGDDQEQRDRALAHGQRGEIEAVHVSCSRCVHRSHARAGPRAGNAHPGR